MRLSVAVALAAFVALHAPGVDARQPRSTAAKHAFMKARPCPAGPDQGSIKRCRGYVVDHIVALACGGPDGPGNMQWQSVAEGKAKDRWERDGCDPKRLK